MHPTSKAYNVNPSAPNSYEAPPSYNQSIGPSQGAGFTDLRSAGTSTRTSEQVYADILNKYEISEDFSTRLQKHLRNTKIVFIYDDSGSMNSILNDSPLNTGVFKATRWDELKNFSKIAIEIATVFNPEGIDIHFLNRPVARAVKHIHDLEPYLLNKPAGFTPIKRIMGRVMAENNKNVIREQNLLLVIVTDGEPTDDNGREDIRGFKTALKERASHVYTTIVSCTDEDHTMDYLNNWDITIPRLDVVDDYKNERLEVLKAKGQRFRFSYGDYIVKILVGSLDPELDNMDERKCSCSVL